METQNKKQFRVSFSYITDEFISASGVEEAFKRLFPEWIALQVQLQS